MFPDALNNSAWWLTALRVYFILHLMAFACWPWWTRLFASQKDRGAGTAMAGGIFVFTLLCQFVWRSGQLEMRFVWLVLLLNFLGMGGRKLFFKPANPSYGTRSRLRHAFLQGWLIFSLLFWYWSWVRSADPAVSHTEQGMDVMWMRAAMAADQPPIRDAWFGGAPASYYTDGHQVLAFLSVKLGLDAPLAVNLTQIIWFALCGLLAFACGRDLCRLKSEKGATLCGLLSLLFLLFVSTPQGALDAGGENPHWWWWKASRVLQDGKAELITEFPFFSFWLGDNHAHLIGIPYLLLSVLTGLQLFRCRKLHFGNLLLPVLLVFLSWRINPWQTPTALAIPLLCLLLRGRSISRREWLQIACCLVLGLNLLFPPRAGGPALSLVFHEGPRSGLSGLFKVFGFLLPGLLLLLCRHPHRIWLAFATLLAGMFLCTEFVYLQDVYQNRMNTVFKVYYQIWIIMALLSALGWTRMLALRKIPAAITTAALCYCLLPGLRYAWTLNAETAHSPDRSLHAWNHLSQEEQAYLHLANELIRPGERIAEAPGKSWDPKTSQLGTWTAGDSMIGWTGHQQQWRPDSGYPKVSLIYTASSREELLNALRLFRVDWLVLGPREMAMYDLHPDYNRWLEGAAFRVVDQPNQKLYRIR